MNEIEQWGFTRSIKIWDKTPKILEKYELYYLDTKIYIIMKINDEIVDRLNFCLVIWICDKESLI